MAEFFTYSAEDVIVIIGGISVSGFADGSAVKIKRNTPTFKSKVGMKGDVTRVKSSDRTGLLTLTLKQSSNINQAFSALALADEATGDGVFPILVKSPNNFTIAVAEHAYIQEWPEIDFSDDESNIEWQIAVADLTLNVGA
ncbi:phage structural protein [Piscirickettsia litoralis]|uniref:Phage tail protein n=1 Tax=Piscirickettsia litoralis TaxID=1891921 RepID=A0ABX3A0T6_9GAMM|nr:phage protein [Piscirickettsia litoralis]ODN41243.1 hypothetical protein BGC07_17670 [Piscirickettsia litoralis]